MSCEPNLATSAHPSPEGEISLPVASATGKIEEENQARRAKHHPAESSMSSHQQLLYHLVFSTKERRQLLKRDKFRDEVWRYMAGVCSNLQGHALRVGGYYDHAHLLVRIPAKIAVADFVRQLKSSTSKHINERRDAVLKFHWQDGYGAFTVSQSKVEAVIRYIDNQVQHHAKRSFKDEFLKMLADHEVEHDPKYIWE